MPHLHEVLAVDKELEQVAWKVVDEATTTFQKKVDHFQAFEKRYEAFSEGRQKEVEGLAEHKTLTTTVPDKLLYVGQHFIRFLDALAQKETTNQEAKADVIMDGHIILFQVPATLLLALEGKLSKLRGMFEAIPTLQPGVEWRLDPQAGRFVYRATKDVIKQKTEKVMHHKVLVEPTKEHPAQIEKWFSDDPIAHSISTYWSGMLSSSQKATLLKRLDSLIYAIKQARMRANEQEVVKFDIGNTLFGYILGDFEEEF